jgi:myotubularin-related protein 10/11/12
VTSPRNFRTFSDEADWHFELERCGFSSQDANGKWRVLQRVRASPEDFLPRCFVVPRELDDYKYTTLCNSFRCKRAAFWVFGYENASLLRMSDLLPELINNPKEVTHSKDNLMLEYIRVCGNAKTKSNEIAQPRCIELTKGLPSIQDVYQSYLRLRTLCAPTSDREMMSQDEKYFTHIEKSSWLLYVSLCIKVSNECANYLYNGESVVLQENDGRDMSCVISSLIQILHDPFYRTIGGLKVLIQKEWIALGHPFADRFGHVYDKSAEKSPIFLLFIDSVWQVMRQFPTAFEYTERFLIFLYDAVFIPIFDTFQFNSEFDRTIAISDDKLVLRSLWEWHDEMICDEDKFYFRNPFYKKPQMSVKEMENYRKSKLPPSALKLPGIAELKRTDSRQKSVDDLNDDKILLPSQILNHSQSHDSEDESKNHSGLDDANEEGQESQEVINSFIF